MKRIVMIAVALVLLFSNLIPAAAMPEGVKYSSTYAFLKELDEYDVIYTYKGIDEDTDEWVYVSYGLSNDADCDLNIFFTSDCEHCVVRIWNLIDFDAAQVNTMYMVCNYLNSSYKYATFYVDESDYSVTVSYDL
ncbi:MAG: hypothetical protein IJS53_01955, partial [Clostridia bacterium]|nr:hypothetical protein [Clostridia bacterium]